MAILFDERSQTFHLRAGQCSYIFQLYGGHFLSHRYFGPALQDSVLDQVWVVVDRSMSPNPNAADEKLSYDSLAAEYPTYGRSDFRMPAIEIRGADGSTAMELQYVAHRIMPGKPRLPGLPATYVESDEEAQTLEIDLRDPLTQVLVTLRYTAFAERSVITRSVRVINHGVQALRMGRVMSASMDMRPGDYEWVHLQGAWARERHVIKESLTPGIRQIESRRGASSHQSNPFVAIGSVGATETHGEVYGVSLVYSGNFQIALEVDQFATTRVMAGINPFDFEWLLEPGEEFTAPEAVFAFSSEGYGGLSETLHRLYQSRLARGKFRDEVRPVLINNWEATYFQFDRDTLVALGKSAAELGIDLLVLDDGWFGHRDNDRSSLGDWIVDRKKLPNGLQDVAQEILACGMQFGLWFEPEMVSPDSDLYRAHPDWCLHVAGRERSLGRHQLVLDFSRADVRDYIVKAVSNILREVPIAYVKWDMNRNMTEVGSALLPPARQRETAHRYMLGLYEVLETITSSFPDVLFESCSGGGGRFDPGMLYYMPQVWTSDDTDAVERLPIQFGTSLAYPASAMGAHVSAVPNHQVGRSTPLATRGFVAMMGNLGYELDVRKLTEEERDTVKQQIALYKQVRHIVFHGTLHRLRDGTSRQEASWMYVAKDRMEAFATFVRVLASPNPKVDGLRLRGLDPDQRYEVTVYGGRDGALGMPAGRVMTVRGDALMGAGIVIPYLHGDFSACAWHIRAV